MKCIATYPAYDLANDRQIDLIAAEIDAVVWYVPTGMDQVYLGTLPIYALLVPTERADDALEIIRLVPDDAHVCIYGCPKCESGRVEEKSLDYRLLVRWWLMAATFTFTGFLALAEMRMRGRLYACADCGHRYRKKP